MRKLPMYKFQLGEIVRVKPNNIGRLLYSGVEISEEGLFGVVEEQIIRDLGDVLYVVRLPEIGRVVADKNSIEKYEDMPERKFRTGSIVVITETQEVAVVCGFWSGETDVEAYNVRLLNNYENIITRSADALYLVD